MLCRDEDEVRQKAKELRLVERPRRDVLSAHPHTANSSAMTITKENAGSELSFRQGVMLEKLIDASCRTCRALRRALNAGQYEPLGLRNPAASIDRGGGVRVLRLWSRLVLLRVCR